MAAQKIKAGDAEIVMAGGMENMSQALMSDPFTVGSAYGTQPDDRCHDQHGLWCSFVIRIWRYC